MRITVSIPDSLSGNLKREAANLKIPVSRLVAKAIEHYLVDRRRTDPGNRVLELAGKARVAENAHDGIHEGRRDDRA